MNKIYFKHKETIHNFFWRSLQIFGKQGITFLIFILCAKLLSPYEFGIYNYVLAVIFFLIIFGDFGISAATSKYVAQYNVTDKDKLKSVLFNSFLVIFILTFLVSIFVFLFGEFFLKEKYLYVIYTLPLLFLAPITSLYDGIYRGLKRFRQLSIISLIAGLISISFVYILIRHYGLIGALISQNLFYFVLFIILALGYKSYNIKFDKKVIKDIFNYSFILGIASVGYILYTRIDILLLGYFDYINEVAYYSFISRVFVFISVPFTILGQIISPNITKYAALYKFKVIKEKFRRLFFISMLLSIICSLSLYILLPVIISHYFPNYLTREFTIMFKIMIWSLPLVIISAVLSQAFIVASGKAKYALLTIPFGLINLIMGYILISNIGFLGVIYASLISSFLIKTITYLLLYKDLLNTANKES
ncbi:MAG: oligosaccharide flippase family protein [Nanoarchaeota archaeon]|nr:oligosaccharide flippase family protein [Nanoarchaeota archaeon]